jgi:glycosyltransferase involved in cell wall biosynthesis
MHEGRQFASKLKRRLKVQTMLSNDVLVGSEYANRVLYSLTGKYGTVVRIGVSGISVGHRTCARQHSSLRVGVLGTIDSNKGQIIALEAVSMARAEGLEVELILAGAEHDQGYSNKLRDFVAVNKLEGIVSFLGRIENTAPFFEAIDVLAVCSYDEVFPTVILEAMREKKLVIATRVGGIPEIIEDGLSGLLYQAGNASELSRCLIEVSRFGDLGLAIVERAHLKFYELYQISSSVEAIKERFSLLLGHSG